MKISFALIAAIALVAKSNASECWSEKYGFECCSPTFHPFKTIDFRQGLWAVEDDKWCGILNGGVDSSKPCWSLKHRYPCCSRLYNIELLSDELGSWGVENGDWCGVVEDKECWANALGYPCCAKSDTKLEFENSSYKWGIEDGIWCGIVDQEKEESNGNYSIQGKNPFLNKLYINPKYVKQIELAINKMNDDSIIEKAESMKNYSNAIWLNSFETLTQEFEYHLKRASEEQKANGEKVLTVFVLYNIPGRGCTRFSTTGELLANKSDIERYKSEYIDYIESTVKQYKDQPIVFIVEPDTLGGLISTRQYPACADAEEYYYEAIAYAIQKLGVLPNVALYLDAGNNSFIGYDDNRELAIKIYSKILKAGFPGTIRGFASNVANYKQWSEPALSRGPDTDWNPNPDEQRFIAALHKDFVDNNIPAYFIEDTSRNGRKIDIVNPGEWCNLSGAGAGARPEAQPVKDMDYLDAFYWVKPLGYSDGTSDSTYAEYDIFCGHAKSMMPAPRQDLWFQKAFEEGIKNANPSL